MYNRDTIIRLHHLHVSGVNSAARSQSLKNVILRRGLGGANYSIPILKNICFTARPGERIGIIGRNGSGKSSMLKVIAGIYPPQAGDMMVVGNVAPLIEMGVGFNDELCGRRNIRLGLVYSNRFSEYTHEMEQKIIEFSGLADKIDLPLKYYSSGMRSRLAFSVAVFQNPDILLLDEVFAAGDAEFVEKSRQLMTEKFQNVPISILVSHSNQQIRDLCTRCVAMKDGEIIADGATEDVMKDYEAGRI